LVVMDYLMPLMNGDELALQLSKKAHPKAHPKMLFYTGFTDRIEMNMDLGKNMDFCGVVSKNDDEKTITETVTRVLHLPQA
jgi:hypothetical protein